MRNLITATNAAAIAAILLATGREALGSNLSLFQADAIVSSAMMDQDLVLPGLTQAAAVNQQTGADFKVSSSGWSGTLSGNYFGNSLAVNYTGDTSAFGSSGTIGWSSRDFTVRVPGPAPVQPYSLPPAATTSREPSRRR